VAEAKVVSTARLKVPFGPFREIRPLKEDPNIRQECGSTLRESPAQHFLSELRVRLDRSRVAAVRNSRAVERRTCDRIAPRRQPSSRNSCSKPPRKRPRSIGVSVRSPKMSRGSTRRCPGRSNHISGTTDLSYPGDRRNVGRNTGVGLHSAL
jgi:hypothetical protein